MKKFKVVGDPSNKPRFSSRIIVDSLNDAAKRLDLYDDNGSVVVYDGVCNSHGYKPDAFICSYEIAFPRIILQNAGGKPIFGVSRDNQRFIIEGGYPSELTNWILLGVDSTLYPKIEKQKNKDKFVVGVYTESLIRGGVELCVDYFGEMFAGKKADHKLCIKDRNGTERFQQWVADRAKFYDIDIEYLNCHFDSTAQIYDWFSGIDVHLYLNRSSTFAMPPAESMCMGIPTIAMSYSGPREFIIDGFTGLCPEYELQCIEDEFAFLQSIGTRNFFFLGGYKKNPVWAKPTSESVCECLLKSMNPDTRKAITENGRIFAKTLTWERSAANLAQVLS